MERLHVVPLPPITCICLYDQGTGQAHQLRFWKIDEDEYEKNKQSVLKLLDDARCIIGYNAVFFDLEFIKQSFGLDAKRMTRWVSKTVDLFMFGKYVLKTTCKLDTLLTLNKLSNKIGTGSDAIQLARDGRWEDLLKYCMMDTMLTYNLFEKSEGIQMSDFLTVRWNALDLDTEQQIYPRVTLHPPTHQLSLDRSSTMYNGPPKMETIPVMQWKEVNYEAE